MKFGIDLQHNGKPNKNDLGFVLEDGTTEYSMIAKYGIGIQLGLIDLSHTTYLNGLGAYKDRAVRFNSVHCNLVVLCHVNKGGGNYGAIFIDYRTSALNAQRAEYAAIELSNDLPWTVKVIRSMPNHWTANAYHVQQGYKAWTWCLEPFFADNPDHMAYIREIGLEEFGRIIADAINSAYGA